MSLHSDISDFNFRSKYFISYNIFSINLYLIHIRYLFLRFPAQQCVIYWDHEERDNHTYAQTADIYDRQTLCRGTAAPVASAIGIIERMVVILVIRIGRIRVAPASMSAVRRSIVERYWLTVST